MCDKLNWEGQNLDCSEQIWHKKIDSIFGCGSSPLSLVVQMHLLKQIVDSLLGVLASIKEASESLLFKFGSLFCHIVVLKDMKFFLASWKKHESQFLNVGFLVWQIFEIPRSQSKTKHIFSIANNDFLVLNFCNMAMFLWKMKNNMKELWFLENFMPKLNNYNSHIQT
jgi:hypothetical protein